MPRSYPSALVNGDGGARFLALRRLDGQPESFKGLWKLVGSSGWLGEVWGFDINSAALGVSGVRAGHARARRWDASLRPSVAASWGDGDRASSTTPRRGLGWLGVIGLVVYPASSIRGSARSSVEHLRKAAAQARTRGKGRGKSRGGLVRATQERQRASAWPEGVRRRRP